MGALARLAAIGQPVPAAFEEAVVREVLASPPTPAPIQRYVATLVVEAHLGLARTTAYEREVAAVSRR